ncbi:MAG: SRPBCC family protein [Actinobacteria bacterium]|nr:SRPBCC family protein [Actinomycetota bacterium]
MNRTAFVVESSIWVDSKPEQLFDLINDDSRFLELRPDAVGHRDVQSLPNGGHSCTQEWDLNARRITLTCRAVRFERPSCFVDEVDGPGFRSTVTTTVEAMTDGSRLTIRQEVVFMGRLSLLRRRAVREDASRRLVAALARMKSVAESGD